MPIDIQILLASRCSPKRQTTEVFRPQYRPVSVDLQFPQRLGFRLGGNPNANHMVFINYIITQIWVALTDGVGRCLGCLALGDRGFRGNLSRTWGGRASMARGRLLHCSLSDSQWNNMGFYLLLSTGEVHSVGMSTHIQIRRALICSLTRRTTKVADPIRACVWRPQIYANPRFFLWRYWRRKPHGTWFTQIWAVLTDGVGRCLGWLVLGDRGFRGDLSGTWDRRGRVARKRAKMVGTTTAVSVTAPLVLGRNFIEFAIVQHGKFTKALHRVRLYARVECRNNIRRHLLWYGSLQS